MTVGRVCKRIHGARDGGRPIPDDLRRELEESFRVDLAAVRVHDGPEADALAKDLSADAFATGGDLFFARDAFQPGTRRGRAIIAHEVCHLLQQAGGGVVGPAIGGGFRVGARRWEQEAHEAGRRFARRQPLGETFQPPPPLPDSSQPSGEVFIQCWDSFEHRLLGDMPQGTLVAMVAGQGSPSSRDAAFGQAIDLMQFMGENATTIESASQITDQCSYVRPLQLPGSGLWVTYGELNTLADYLADPSEIATASSAVLLPILQTMREASFNVLTYLQQHVTLPWPYSLLLKWQDFAGSLNMHWAPGWLYKILESQALDELTTGLGTAGRDHYSGLLARNACHFAPFTWFRWMAFYELARQQALTANQSQNPADITQAWITHGYADHFLQDAFASGHLVNKTMVMQWFIEWAEANTTEFLGFEIGVPVHDWDAIQDLTPTLQPNLSGPTLYLPGAQGPSNDPQTAEEQPNASPPALYTNRMNATGVVGGSQSYQNYLTMLQNLVVQGVTARLHDTFNATALSVSASGSGANAFEVWGDDAMLNGGTGPGMASAAAQQSQQSIVDIISSGGTDIQTSALMAQFPSYVQDSKQQWVSLAEWHGPGGDVLQAADEIFDSVITYATGAASYRTDLGIVSVDQPEVATFNEWGPAVGLGCVTALRPAAACFNARQFIFYIPAGTTSIVGISTDGQGSWADTTLPQNATSAAPPAAAVWNNQLYLAFKSLDGTVQLVSSVDGSSWTTQTAPGVNAGPFGVGLASFNGALYVSYCTAAGGVELMWMAPDGWHGPSSVGTTTAYASPALASLGADILVLAYQGAGNSIQWASCVANGQWYGPVRIGSDQTQGDVALVSVPGGVYLAYWGMSSRLYYRQLPAGHTWNSAHQVDGFTGSGPVALTTSVDGQQPTCVFPQLGALYTTTFSGTVWGLAYAVGALVSDLPPAMSPFQGTLCAALRVSWELYFTAFDGTKWSTPKSPAPGVGTGFRPAMLTVDGTQL